MYHIFDEPKNKELLDEWSTLTGDFNQIKGYTDLGDIFLLHEETGSVGVLLTMENVFHDMGFNSWDEFSENVLSNPKFQEDVLNKEFVEVVRACCGELDNEEVYIPIPYPCLGGSGEPDTYRKGNLWVFLAVSSQTFTQI